MKLLLIAEALFLAMLATAGCISWMSAEPQADGGAVVCAKVLPTSDAGTDAAQKGTVSPTPVMQYVPVHAGGER